MNTSKNFIHLVFLPIIFSQSVSVQGQEAPLWNDLKSGPYETGFQREWVLDQSRIWPRSPHLDSLTGNIARPIRIDIWYPADCTPTKGMSLREYVFMDAPAPEFEDLVFLARRWDEYSYRRLAEDSTAFERLMSTETAACKNAKPASGPFPLVLYSAGWFNRAPDNTILAEYLASHGFVVAAVPQLNPGLWTFNFRSDARSVENQIRDLEFTLGVLSNKSFVDRRDITAMGYSTGGDVALLLQGRNPQIDAVIGLDALWSITNDNDVIESPFFDKEYHTLPVLALRRPVENAAVANAVLDSLKYAPRIVAEVPEGEHGSFSDDPSQRKLLGIETHSPYTTHEKIARTVLKFLKTHQSETPKVNYAKLVQQLRNHGLNSSYIKAVPLENQK